MSETKHTPLPVDARPGDGRIYDARGTILCWMGGAGTLEEAEILSRRDELITSVNARPQVEELLEEILERTIISAVPDFDTLLAKAREVEAALKGSPEDTNSPEQLKARGGM